MKNISATFIVLACAATPEVVVAQGAETVGTILPACEQAAVRDLSSPLASYCLGFVSGIGRMATYNCYSDRTKFHPNPMLSATGQASDGARLQAFVNWARAHPENWDLDVASGVVISLQTTFPCEDN